MVGQDKESVSAVSVLRRGTQADGHAVNTSVVAPGGEVPDSAEPSRRVV